MVGFSDILDIGYIKDLQIIYYWSNSQELLQNAKDKYHNCGGKEKAAEYYLLSFKRKSRK